MKQRQRLRMERKRKSMLLRKAMKYIEAELAVLRERIVNQIVDDYIDRCFRAVLRADAKLNGEAYVTAETHLVKSRQHLQNIRQEVTSQRPAE